MNGWCKFLSEDENLIKIAYSLEKNNSCDGELIYSKDTKEIAVAKLATNAGDVLTKAFICGLRGRMRRGFKFDKIYYIAMY